MHLVPKLRKGQEHMVDHRKAFVQEDDVCIHVIGLPASLSAQEAFSAVFGVFPESKVWKIAGTLLEIFDGGLPGRFYHRDQFVPSKSPLGRLGMNYHGELSLSSDRMAIQHGNQHYDTFQKNLTDGIEKAISTFPDLAEAIMQEMINTKSQALQRILRPSSKDCGPQWKTAFEMAHGAGEITIYPYAQRAREENLIHEFGFLPVPLADWQMKILEDSGA